MKNFIRNLCFGGDSKITTILVLFVLIFVGLGCNSLRQLSEDKPSNTDNRRADNDGPFADNTPERKRSTKATGDVPSDEDLDALVRTSIQDFADAVEEGDFSNFRETVSEPFKQQFTAEKFNEAFAPFIRVKDRVVPVLRSTASMTPSYSPEPSVNTVGKYKALTANGVYASTPPTNFELQYINEDGEWKLIKIQVIVK